MSFRTRRPAALALHGVALVVLLGGTAAWTATDKTVTVSVDGATRTVSTHGATVADVLAAASLRAGPHDLLAPSAASPIANGGRVTLRHGRQLRLVVDGSPRTVWVTAASVAEALDQIGVRAGSAVSASRSRPIPLSGMTLSVHTPKQVDVLADGSLHTVATTGVTVRDALSVAGVSLAPTDEISAAPTALLRDGMTIQVTRVRGGQASEAVPIPFDTVTQPDSGMYQGDQRIVQAGRPGVLVRTYLLHLVDGKETGRTLAGSEQTAAPVTQIVAVGTRPRPQPAAPPSSSGGLNWAALAQCESGGNPRSVSSGGTYRGLYQFSMSTWHGVGGSGDPIDASPSEQTYRAQILYSRTGRSSWPVCGAYL